MCFAAMRLTVVVVRRPVRVLVVVRVVLVRVVVPLSTSVRDARVPLVALLSVQFGRGTHLGVGAAVGDVVGHRDRWSSEVERWRE